MYGFEELTPSVYAMDHGYVHLFVPEIAMNACIKYEEIVEMLVKNAKFGC